MPVKVNNNLVEPAPFVRISKEPIVAGNQTKLGQTYQLSIQGTLVAWKGSPQGGSLVNPSWGGPFNLFWQGSAPAPDEPAVLQFHKLYNIEAKQRALEELFSINGSTIEWQSPDGSQPMKAQFKNARVEYPEGTWAQTCPYTITAECDLLYLLGNPVVDAPFSGFIQSADENWDIQIGEVVKTFTVQHQVNAVGKLVFDQLGIVTQPAWMNARDFVLSQLILGWSGTSTYSNIAGSTIFKESSLASGGLNFSQYNPYNTSRVETVDELAGSYSVTETFTLAPLASGTNIYSVSTRKIVDDPYCTVVSQIQGTIQGFYEGLFNYDQRIAAADYVWSTLSAPTGLLNLIPINTTGLIYNDQPRQGSLDYNINDGTITYNYEFSNQLFENDAFEQWTVSRKTSLDNYITTYGIAGTVKGRRYDGDTDVLSGFNRAYEWWSTLSGNNYASLFNRIISSKYFPEASGMGLQTSPFNKSIDINEGEGSINYNLEFNNRRNIEDIDNDNVEETFQITQHASVDDGITTYTLNGEVIGLNVSDISPQQSKWSAASGYFYGVVVPNLYNRLSTYFNISLPNQNPLVSEITEQPLVGVITYNYEFRSTFPPIIAGVLSEHITINDENLDQSVNVFSRIGIPGRGQGPILQDLGTTTEKMRSVDLEVVVTPTGGSDFLACYNTKPDYTSYILQVKPANAFTEKNSESYDFKNGRYHRSVSWVYE